MAESRRRKQSSASSSQRSNRSSGGSGSSGRGSGAGSSKRSTGNSRGSSSRRSSRKEPGAREVVRAAAAQVQELIGRPVEAVTGVEKDGSAWTVTVEVLELSRIPNTTDVLGCYQVTLDRDGDVMGARRTRRYYRSEAGED